MKPKLEMIRAKGPKDSLVEVKETKSLKLRSIDYDLFNLKISGHFDQDTGVLTLKMPDGSAINIEGLYSRTAIGEGMPGDSGLAGLDGKDGLPGALGPMGEPGFVGEMGSRGDSGERGSLGEPGRVGKRGKRGRVGERGSKGKRGFAGMLGETGPEGPRGDVIEQKIAWSLTDPGSIGPKNLWFRVIFIPPKAYKCGSKLRTTGEKPQSYYVTFAPVAGIITARYSMSAKGSIKVYYGDVLIGSTMGSVAGEGSFNFEFPYDSSRGNILRAEMTASSETDHCDCVFDCPIPIERCGVQLVPQPGVTTYYYDIGKTSGSVAISYNMKDSPGSIVAYLGTTKVASTGTKVSGIGTLYFNYAYRASVGSRLKLVIESTAITWSCTVKCPVTALYNCGATVYSKGTTATLYSVNMGAKSGAVTVEYGKIVGTEVLKISYGSTELATVTATDEMPGSLTFNFAYRASIGTKLTVAVTDSSESGAWECKIGCPVPSTVDCGQPVSAIGASAVQTLHVVGTTSGTLTLNYSTGAASCGFKIYYGSTQIFATPSTVKGTGSLTCAFAYKAAVGNKVKVEVTSQETAAWTYTLNCPTA
jgi:hypothetical protein